VIVNAQLGHPLSIGYREIGMRIFLFFYETSRPISRYPIGDEAKMGFFIV
jgi:hypothetical protein